MRVRDRTTSVSVRFPVDLHRRLRKQAQAEHRSFNGQVVKTLTEVVSLYETSKRNGAA